MTEFEFEQEEELPAIDEQPKEITVEIAWYTVTEVAKEIGVSYQSILKRIHRGTLKADKVYGMWRIPRESLQTTRRQPNRASGTNQINVNVSDDLKTVLLQHKSKINVSAMFEAGMWMLLAELVPEITYTDATNQARGALGKSSIILDSAWETSSTIMS